MATDNTKQHLIINRAVNKAIIFFTCLHSCFELHVLSINPHYTHTVRDELKIWFCLPAKSN